MYLGWIEPHDTKSAQRLELANEAIFQVICYIVALSMISPGLRFDTTLGWSLNILVSILLGLNLLYVALLAIL